MSDAVLRRREGSVRVLVNNNPGARNAITSDFYAALTTGLADAQADAEIGAIVLTGAGDFFCAGGDLNQLAKRRELSPAERRERLEGLHDLVRAIRDCANPVVAAVEGGAAGAGLSLALACDLLVSARDAFFSVPT
jgi:enoyl-CoA hydratase/carnithine racemase